MKNIKNSHDLLNQNKENVNKSQKSDVNLQKNTTIYFQVGLIVCLLFSYGLLEMQFETNKYVPEVAYHIDDEMDYVPDNFKIYVEPVKEVKKVAKKVTKITEVIKVVKNNTVDVVETLNVITTPEITNTVPVAIKDIPNVVKTEEPAIVPYAFVEVVPVFPGCEEALNNAERKKCMSEKIAKHIQKKFDTEIASDLGLEGMQQINVMFEIDENGNITDIKARSKHKQLENEAKEVIGKLPQMTPGKQHDKNVSVSYGIPIKFNIQK